MTMRETLEIELDRLVSRIDADARDNGHVPAWETETERASASCSCCGKTAAARVWQDGRTWLAGKLLTDVCPS